MIGNRGVRVAIRRVREATREERVGSWVQYNG